MYVRTHERIYIIDEHKAAGKDQRVRTVGSNNGRYGEKKPGISQTCRADDISKAVINLSCIIEVTTALRYVTVADYCSGSYNKCDICVFFLHTCCHYYIPDSRILVHND